MEACFLYGTSSPAIPDFADGAKVNSGSRGREPEADDGFAWSSGLAFATL
jgi:hypothetical protein